eukprot:2570561-Amphidinium_carterae.3
MPIIVTTASACVSASCMSKKEISTLLQTVVYESGMYLCKAMNAKIRQRKVWAACSRCLHQSAQLRPHSQGIFPSLRGFVQVSLHVGVASVRVQRHRPFWKGVKFMTT